MRKGYGQKLRPTLSHNITKYAVLRMAAKEVPSGPGPACPDLLPHTEPTLRDIIMVIQSVKGTLEPTLEVNLIRADLKQVTEKVTMAESHISGLQLVAKRLEE
ncbi:hypothetical protein NDU88_000898 [Pleurodeles waltl]|uniref:Uncharacterized protein n=1 Tax=Pleurodeles waltl TaxID=8319 RepID=A0AAV7VYM2_PLEWA|nr:hypothetical protein NDU88_000898 [Pleurodeles waltl]